MNRIGYVFNMLYTCGYIRGKTFTHPTLIPTSQVLRSLFTMIIPQNEWALPCTKPLIPMVSKILRTSFIKWDHLINT